MTKAIVADTGPLIALALVELLPSLPHLFSEIYVPHGVLAEATKDVTRPGAQAINVALENGWITTRPVEITEIFQELSELLDQGEAEALALAKQLNAVALIDERRGRKVALRQGISITGSAAIIIKAKQRGLVPKVKPLLVRLREHGYRMSETLTAEILRRVNEPSDEG